MLLKNNNALTYGAGGAVGGAVAEKTMLKGCPVKEVENAAVLMASDYACAITGAIANVSCGEIAD